MNSHEIPPVIREAERSVRRTDMDRNSPRHNVAAVIGAAAICVANRSESHHLKCVWYSRHQRSGSLDDRDNTVIEVNFLAPENYLDCDRVSRPAYFTGG
jgi:hypothetical protein